MGITTETNLDFKTSKIINCGTRIICKAIIYTVKTTKLFYLFLIVTIHFPMLQMEMWIASEEHNA